MGEEIYYPPKSLSSIAHINSMEQYRVMYEHSINSPDEFWAEQADKFCWFKKWDKVRSFNYDVNKGNIYIEWFKGGQCNITSNCLDRHLEARGDQIAILWEGNEPGVNKTLTYKELHREVCKFAMDVKCFFCKQTYTDARAHENTQALNYLIYHIYMKLYIY